MSAAGVLTALTAFYGFSGVAMGAFAAHALKSRLDDYALSVIQTATQYQLIHAVAMLALLMADGSPEGARKWALYSFALGVPLFSGSLYALGLSGIKVLGAITPIGGTLFLLGWGCVFMHGLHS